jgi:hypothetical protein
MGIITKQLAERIAKKLGAEIVKSGAHDIAYVYHNGQLIGEFGIRRGSKKDAGHDHIPRDLRIGPSQARLLGQCPLKLTDFIAILVGKGLIENSAQEEE